MKNLKTFEEFVKSINEARNTELNEIADWDTYKKIKDRATISCDDDEKYERKPIRDAVNKQYPGRFTTEEINEAIEHCCNKKGQSRQREDFYKCVFNTLLKRTENQ